MRLASILLCLVVAGPAAAQIRFGEMGFQVASPTGGTAGDFCWGFDCTPRPLTALAGETLTVTVRAPLGAPFVVVFAARASSCAQVPGIWNSLVVDPPLVALFAGAIDQPNFARVCYDGYAVRPLALPATLPQGFAFALQAAATIGTPPQPSVGWGMASAVAVTVR